MEVPEVKKVILLVIALLVTFSVIGCETNEKLTPTERAEVTLYKQYLDLPNSTKTALKAKNMVGKTVFNSSDRPVATKVYEVLLLNGARQASRKQADMIITSKSGIGMTRVTITDNHGSKFTDNLVNFVDAIDFGQQVANAIGTSRKVTVLHPATTPSEK